MPPTTPAPGSSPPRRPISPAPPSTEAPRATRASRRTITEMVERLYVYWLVSTALLLFVLVLVVIMTRGQLREHARAQDELRDQVQRLTQEVSALRAALEPGVRPLSLGPAPAPRSPDTVEPHAGDGSARPTAHDATRPPAERPPPELPPPAATQPLWPAEDTIQEQIDAVVIPDPVTPLDLSDAAAGTALVDLAQRHIGRAQWRGETWARLATVALLLGRAQPADLFAERARAAGAALATFDEIRVRSLLAAGSVRAALASATRLDPTDTAAVLAAAAHLANGDATAADAALEALRTERLALYDKLLLGRVLLELERWRDLGAVLGSLHGVPEAWRREFTFLTAAALAHADRTVEALAMLDGLNATPVPATMTTPGSPAWPAPEPKPYEIGVWRGVTLLLARQTDPARQALQAAAGLAPAQPEAHLHLGLLEAGAGRPELAMSHLKNALACSARLAPAWEALALLELDNGRLDEALEHAQQAIAANGRRAAGQFLLARIHAHLGQKAAAAEALLRAFTLDPAYVAQARGTEAITGLFSAAELATLAAGSPLPATAPTTAAAQPAERTPRTTSAGAPGAEEPVEPALPTPPPVPIRGR